MNIPRTNMGMVKPNKENSTPMRGKLHDEKGETPSRRNKIGIQNSRTIMRLHLIRGRRTNYKNYNKQ